MASGIDLLIVDDEDDFRAIVKERFEESGHRAAVARSGEEALSQARARYFDVAILDIHMPGMDGMELWRHLREQQPELEVLFVTGHATVDSAIEAMRQGAYDYLTKPVELAELEILAQKAYEKRLLRKQTVLLREELARQGGREANMVGRSLALQTVLQQIRQVAPTNSPVLIEGATGTGKELVAQAIHNASLRSERSIVAVNCGSLQENLLENELFGHERGAFTGALNFKRGLLEVADEGSLFIDEIGEMEPSVQVKLLRVIETGTFRRLGNTREMNVDVRFICATNRNLEEEVREGRFREDLYYRLNVFKIEVPLLRRRKDDIPLLAYHFLANGRGARPDGPREIAQDAMSILIDYDWPGNVRELANVVEHASILCMGPTLRVQDLPVTLRDRPGSARFDRFASSEGSGALAACSPLGPPTAEEGRQSPGGNGASGPSGPPLSRIGPSPDGSIPSLAEIEKGHILATLDTMGGNRTRAARSLGISVRHLRRKLQAYGYRGPGLPLEEGGNGSS